MSLENVKPGDFVAVYKGRDATKELVKSTTKTQITTDTGRFLKSSGFRVGDRDKFFRHKAFAWSDAHERSIESTYDKRMRIGLLQSIKQYRLDLLTKNQLEEINKYIGSFFEA